MAVHHPHFSHVLWMTFYTKSLNFRNPYIQCLWEYRGHHLLSMSLSSLSLTGFLQKQFLKSWHLGSSILLKLFLQSTPPVASVQLSTVSKCVAPPQSIFSILPSCHPSHKTQCFFTDYRIESLVSQYDQQFFSFQGPSPPIHSAPIVHAGVLSEHPKSFIPLCICTYYIVVVV